MQLRPNLNLLRQIQGLRLLLAALGPVLARSTVITAFEFPVCGGLENFCNLLKGKLSHAVSIFKQAVRVLRLS